MTTAPTELKPCPFCAGPAKMIRPMGDRVFNWDTQGKQVPPYYGPRWFRLVCANENCHVVTRACLTEAEAIAAWNTRAPAALEPQSVDDAMVERMARAHDKEEAAQRGEPSPWDDPTIDAAWIAERITCMRAALQAAKEPSHG